MSPWLIDPPTRFHYAERMKKSSITICTTIASLLFITPTIARSSDALQQQVDNLSQRLTELEQRLDALEKKPKTVTRTTIIKTESSLPPPTNPGEWRDATNWVHLKIGMDYQDVRDLLGEPVKIRSGASEFWYYTDKKFDGPHLKFLFKKLNSWKTPENEAGTD